MFQIRRSKLYCIKLDEKCHHVKKGKQSLKQLSQISEDVGYQLLELKFKVTGCSDEFEPHDTHFYTPGTKYIGGI